MDTVKFALGEIVYLKVKTEEAGMVTGLLFRQTGIVYMVTWPDRNEQYHHEMELTAEKTYSLAS